MLKLYAVAIALSLPAGPLLAITPTMEADPAEIGSEGMAYINALGDAYERRANEVCNNTEPSYQEREKRSYRRYGKDGAGAREKFRCLFFKNDPTAPEIKHYMDAGFSLSSYYCKNFFGRISEHSQKRGFARNSVNDAGTTMSVILGLAKAGSIATGGIGAVFGLADGVFRTYEQQFMISADLANVQMLVLAAQGQYRKNASEKRPDNYYEATAMIAEHANFCSYVGMKILINASVNKNVEATTKGVAANSSSLIEGSTANSIAAGKRAEALVDKKDEAKDVSTKAAADKVVPAPTP